MTYPEVVRTFQKYMLLDDYSVIKFAAAVMVANRFPQLTPTFAFLVGASSGGKSTILDSLLKTSGAFPLDDLTTKTFISGAKSKDGQSTSLLQNLPPNAVLILSDFTVMLSKDEQEAGEIMTQLRLIYDGRMKKIFGTGDSVPWEGRLGFLAGVTTAVYEQQHQYAALGERMVYYQMGQPHREDATNMSLSKAGVKLTAKKEMSECMAAYINTNPVPETIPDLEETFQRNLVRLSEMATRARSSVSRKRFSRDNQITQVNDLEMPMRMANQLLNLSQALLVLGNGSMEEGDERILYKVALDSIPMLRRKVIEKLTAPFQQATIKDLASALSLPYETVKPSIEELCALEVVSRVGTATTTNPLYELKPEYRAMVAEFRNMPIGTSVSTDEGTPDEFGFNIPF